MKNIPLHNIGDMTFEESHFVYQGKRWNAADLVNFAKEKKYKTFDLPLCGIDLGISAFNTTNMDAFIFQMKRVENTNLDYPIILSDMGQIADGWHRVCKAILQGKKTIKAIRLLEMPKPLKNKK